MQTPVSNSTFFINRECKDQTKHKLPCHRYVRLVIHTAFHAFCKPSSSISQTYCALTTLHFPMAYVAQRCTFYGFAVQLSISCSDHLATNLFARSVPFLYEMDL